MNFKRDYVLTAGHLADIFDSKAQLWLKTLKPSLTESSYIVFPTCFIIRTDLQIHKWGEHTPFSSTLSTN